MKCERCDGLMKEEQLIVSGDTITTKEVSAWHCPDCGRIEYRATARHRLILEHAEHPHAAWYGGSHGADAG